MGSQKNDKKNKKKREANIQTWIVRKIRRAEMKV